MRKIILILWFASVSFALVAQEKGLHLSINGSLASTSLGYRTDTELKSKANLGYGALLGVQYFFTKNWGIATGVGAAFYQSSINYNNAFAFNQMIDDDPLNLGETYNLRLGLANWTETQKSYMLEIPVMAAYQKKWGIKDAFGIYFGIGVKLQLPFLSNNYNVDNNSELSVSGYYESYDLTLDDLPAYGFGTVNKTGYKDEFDMKFGLSASAELGILIALGKRCDLTLGAYVDYALLNMQKNNVEPYLINPEKGAQSIHPADYVGDHIQYNGLLNSSSVNKVKPLAIGAKAGVRIKIGKLTEKTAAEIAEMQKNARSKFGQAEVVIVRDSVVIQPVVVEIAQQQPIIHVIEKANEKVVNEDLNILVEPIYFDLSKYDLTEEAKKTLDQKAEMMKKYPHTELTVFGHTCDLGGESLNDKLAFNRAQAARYYIIRQGIKPSRITVISEGKRFPNNPNTNENNRKLNRRVDFFFGE